MSPWIAAAVITWIAIIVLYLGLAATLHRVRMLSAELAALRAGGNVRASGVDLRLPALAAPEGSAPRLVVAADTGCPACHMAVDALAAVAPRLSRPPTLLTYEPPELWREAVGRLDIRQDPESWRVLGHLMPPLLLSVDAQGRVIDLALPSTPDDIPRTLATWGFRPSPADPPIEEPAEETAGTPTSHTHERSLR
ncbi:MAG TPA: hypothetical protein VFC19_11235 [Candidatus Limnocylindrales bacterium]|nr:hypothetical protein [Candidatus Limnocylindrales bacterium]